MSYETIHPGEASPRLDEADYCYIDVWSVPEYEAGHVPGAYNIPLLHMTPAGMQPNEGFVEAMERHFEKDAKLILGCKIGGRSGRACELLAGMGYSKLVNMDGGFSGRYDEAGELLVEGWAGRGLPVTTTPESGRTWSELGG